jgi:hypothetical protein
MPATARTFPTELLNLFWLLFDGYANERKEKEMSKPEGCTSNKSVV